MIKIKEIRDMTNDELENFVNDLSEELRRLRFQNVTSKLDSTARVKQAKIELARTLTVLREREIAKRNTSNEK